MRSIGAHATGAAARGSVLTVIADAVARFGPDQILLALHSPAHANWQEHGLIAHGGSPTPTNRSRTLRP